MCINTVCDFVSMCVIMCESCRACMCAYFTCVWPRVLSVPPGDLTEATRRVLGPPKLRGHLGSTWSLTGISDQEGPCPPLWQVTSSSTWEPHRPDPNRLVGRAM